MDKHLSVYTAESNATDVRLVLHQMLLGALRGRYIAYRLFVRDVKGDYSRSKFGALWDFVEPLVVAGVFAALYDSGVIQSGEIGIPYPVFVVFGVLMWQTFSEAITYPLDLIRSSRSLITHLRIMPESLLLSVFLRVLFNSSFRIVIMLAVALAMRSLSLAGVVPFVLLFPLLIVAGMAIGVLLAPFNAIYSDVGRVVRISLRPLMYATPVMWTLPKLPFFSYLGALNPAATMLSNLRSLATSNAFDNLAVFVGTASVLGMIFLVGCFVFRLSIPILTERA